MQQGFAVLGMTAAYLMTGGLATGLRAGRWNKASPA